MTAYRRFAILCPLLILAMEALCMASDGGSIGAAASGDSTRTVAIGRWARFECAVQNAKPYGDPYSDVALNVVCRKPDGGEFLLQGFYDGGATWRFRVMPDQAGTWRCRASFSDGAPGADVSFECVESIHGGISFAACGPTIDGRIRVLRGRTCCKTYAALYNLPGMISRDESNPMWFGFAGGKHVLIRALHVGDRFFASNWLGVQRAAFLDWAQAQGYNLLSAASHYLNRDATGRGQGWNTPKLWPLDAAEYRRMEGILDDLAARRMMVYPFAGFFGKNSDYPKEPADQERYVHYALARLGAYWNILLNVAGPEPNVGKSWMPAEEVARLGGLIQSLDVFGHPLSVHNRRGDDPYRDSPWTSYGTLQGPKTVDRKQLGTVLTRNHHPGKPLLAQETLWPGNTLHPPYSDDDIRKNAFVINFSAAALCFGDMNGNSSSGFSATMDLADKVQSRHDIVKRVWDFVGSVPFHRMKPRPDLVDRGWCLAEPGREYLIYLELPGAVNVKLEGGPFGVEWINARDTTERHAQGTTRDGRDLRPPPGGDDWLLRLK